MNERIQKLFLGKLELEEELLDFCNQIPDLVEARTKYSHLLDQVQTTMGYPFSNQFEETINIYWYCLGRAYYLFGLNLRQDILTALL